MDSSAQSRGLIATVKHYAAYNQEGTGPLADMAQPGMTLQALGILATEGNRMGVSANVDERALREVHLPPFEAAVTTAGAGAVMCSYNRVNGTHACQHPGLLDEVLRGDWGFEGFVLADYNAAHDAGESLRAGLDFEPWPGFVYSPAAVRAALLSGGASMADVDRSVRRYLRTLFAHGALDRPAHEADEELIDKKAHASAARRIAEAGTVLLRNDGLLPLRARRLDSIAVIGAAADEFVTGGGSSEIDPFSYTTPLAGIARRAGAVPVVHDDGSDLARAATIASEADVAIVIAPAYLTEGVDRRCLSLDCPPVWGDQDALIEAVAAANPRTAVVLESGGPVLTPWRARVGAVLSAWYPGAEGGTAIARVLFGDVDPGGRLPVTFPEREADLPTAGDPRRYPGVDNQVSYSEGVFVGHRWYDERRIRPAFAFGHGGSYTRFRFADLRLRASGEGARRGELARVSVAVTNAGRRRGVAVPQLYLRLPEPRPAVTQPPQALKGFAKLKLAPGATRRAQFRLDRRALSYWDVERDRWRIARGCYRVLVGRSSRRLPLRGTLAVGRACGRAAVRVGRR
ncbi:MAG: glycoside hydrolase family 3 C-terminal domain-containing protein [Solirubrobacterales bacterium]